MIFIFSLIFPRKYVQIVLVIWSDPFWPVPLQHKLSKLLKSGLAVELSESDRKSSEAPGILFTANHFSYYLRSHPENINLTFKSASTH